MHVLLQSLPTKGPLQSGAACNSQQHARSPQSHAMLLLTMRACVLNRFPKLDHVRLNFSDRDDNRPLPAAMLLGNLRTAVPGLQTLGLGLGSSHDWTAAPYCWDQLAEFTQLKTLNVECKRVGAAGNWVCAQHSVLEWVGLDSASRYTRARLFVEAVYEFVCPF
mgnify:FL=1